MFRLAPNMQKCLKDEMQGNQIVAGEYEVTGAPGQKINYVVSDGICCLRCGGECVAFFDFLVVGFVFFFFCRFATARAT